MNLRSLTAGAVAAALALVAAPTRAEAPTPVRAAYIPVVTWLRAWVAKETSSQSTAST